jgi:hypothetical protein
VSLGVVGDVFEVMAQVDRRLTKVNSAGLNNPAENMGRHIQHASWLAQHSSRSITLHEAQDPDRI